MSKRSDYYLIFIGTVTILALLSLAVDAYSWRHKKGESVVSFQRVVGGLGMGATLKPSWCYISYDPRLENQCSCIEWPIPGGYCFCPDHTGTVTYFEEAPSKGL